MARRRSASFDPAGAAGLILDLWGEAGITTTGSGVSSWIDGEASLDFVQSNDGLRPPTTTIGGQDAVSFTDTTLLENAVLASTVQDYTLIVAIDIISNGTSEYFFDVQTGRLIFCLGTSTAGQLGIFDGGFRNLGTQATGEQILTFSVEAGTGSEAWRGSTSLGTSTYSAQDIGGTVGVGGDAVATSKFVDAKVGRLMLFDTIDTTRDGQVRSWMSSHYGISL